jgi:hypothetical protein
VIPVLLALLLAVNAATAPGGLPTPPEAVFEPDLTKAVTARAQIEVKATLARLDRDTTMPAATKADLRKKIERLRLAVYTTPKTLDETVAFYEQAIVAANFLFGERGLLDDAAEIARAGGFALPATTTEAWTGKRGRSARWNREDGAMEVDVEDHLVDPRDGTIRKKTVILLTSTQ